MSNFPRLENVPADYESRKELWIRSGLWLSSNDGPLLALSVEDLGYSERVLLDMERRLASSRRLSDIDRESLLMECSAHSKLWIFGLYEIVRAFRETRSPKFLALKKVFHDLEVLRMPLAKHELKKLPGHSKAPHYPTGLWDTQSGRIGWHVQDPVKKTMRPLTRTSIADEFLSLTATEPLFHVAPLVGSPLGRSITSRTTK